MFAMTWYAQRVFPVRTNGGAFTAVGAAVTLLLAAARSEVAVALGLSLVYPLVLLPLGFYLPAGAEPVAGAVRPLARKLLRVCA